MNQLKTDNLVEDNTEQIIKVIELNSSNVTGNYKVIKINQNMGLEDR